FVTEEGVARQLVGLLNELLEIGVEDDRHPECFGVRFRLSQMGRFLQLLPREAVATGLWLDHEPTFKGDVEQTRPRADTTFELYGDRDLALLLHETALVDRDGEIEAEKFLVLVLLLRPSDDVDAVGVVVAARATRDDRTRV